MSELSGVSHGSPLPKLDCQHLLFQHHPGEGGLSMAFVVHRRLKFIVHGDPTWVGRCGGMHLYQKFAPTSQAFNYFVIGAHFAHGELCADSMLEVATLVKNRPRGSTVIVTGDFNIDQLPACSSDPWEHLQNRASHHRDERDRLHAFTGDLRLEMSLPSIVHGCPGGQFGEECLISPITRIPVGAQCISSLPSLLDFCLHSPGSVEEVSAEWSFSPADHACVIAKGSHTVTQSVSRQGGKRKWVCKDEEGCRKFVEDTAPR